MDVDGRSCTEEFAGSGIRFGEAAVCGPLAESNSGNSKVKRARWRYGYNPGKIDRALKKNTGLEEHMKGKTHKSNVGIPFDSLSTRRRSPFAISSQWDPPHTMSCYRPPRRSSPSQTEQRQPRLPARRGSLREGQCTWYWLRVRQRQGYEWDVCMPNVTGTVRPE